MTPVTSGDFCEDVEDRVQLVWREPAVGVLSEQQLALAVADGLQRYVDHRHDLAVRTAQPDPPRGEDLLTCPLQGRLRIGEVHVLLAGRQPLQT